MSRQTNLHNQVGSTLIRGWKGDNTNPMAACFGRLTGKKCGDCSSIVPVTKPGLDDYNKPIMNIVGYECLKRGTGLGRQTKHSPDWNACVKFNGNKNTAEKDGPASR